MAGSGSADVAATAKSGCLKGSKRSDAAAYQRREQGTQNSELLTSWE